MGHDGGREVSRVVKSHEGICEMSQIFVKTAATG